MNTVTNNKPLTAEQKKAHILSLAKSSSVSASAHVRWANAGIGR